MNELLRRLMSWRYFLAVTYYTVSQQVFTFKLSVT